MKHNPVRWFEIYVQDMKRAKKFYEKVFAVKLEKLKMPGMEMWSFPMTMKGMGCAGALVCMQGVSPGGNSTVVYFASEDCAGELPGWRYFDDGDAARGTACKYPERVIAR